MRTLLTGLAAFCLFFTAGVGQSFGSCVPAPPGLVGWWSGDNNSLDTVGHNNGILVNGASYSAGLVNSAFSFDGIDDYVNAFSEPSSFFSNSEAFTLEAWFRPESETSSYFILRNAAFGLRWQGSSSPMDFYNGTDHFSSKTSWQVGRWYHVALVDDGVNSVKLYIDGVLDKSDDGALRNPNRFPCHPAGYCFELQFGGYYETHDVEYFKGQVDEVTLYNRALTAAEIQTVFAAGSQGKCSQVECNSNLAACLDDRALCHSDLVQCTDSLSRAQNDLAVCSTDLGVCNVNLTIATANLIEAQQGLIEIRRLMALPFGQRGSIFSCSGLLCADLMAVIQQLLNPSGQNYHAASQ